MGGRWGVGGDSRWRPRSLPRLGITESMKQILALVAVIVGLGCSDSTAPVSNSFAGVWGVGSATSGPSLSVTQTASSISGILVLADGPAQGVTLSGTVVRDSVSFTLTGGAEIPSTFTG